ncbi:PAS domain-containing sensor histidine kinase [Clostridiaceae bacterium UIB06]|uniref:histidine kinase n=1 Tax=Clostridium thailandense TaxID=2794346 RepID=A0A949U0L5_9CLOT|nr:PAS domain-containing sensor histidine kinase [Clostridium thailandense]MBV7275236.1 PAS domain-containing sensor histidine kinase [Clostridium thailandense]MCH5137747.1 PAS domain-containing sensor histidine kinase [Clostridiaceae bacterium UIB06]
MLDSCHSSFTKNNNKNFYMNCNSDMFENIIESVPIGIVILDKNYKIILWNSIQESMTGIKNKDVIEKNFFDEFPSLFYSINDRLKNIFLSNETIFLNYFPFYTDSSYYKIKYFNIKINVLNKPDGFQGILFSVEDCTKLESIESNLHENKETLRAVFDSTIEGILVLDNHGNVINYNKRLKKIMGFSGDPIDKEELLDLILNGIEKPELTKDKINIILKAKKKFFNILELKNGKLIECLSNPLVKNNLIIGRIYSFRDITKQKSDEKLLKESENYYRKLIELLPVSIFLHSDDKIIFANKATVKLLGFSSTSELLGKNLFDFISPDFHEIAKNRAKLVQKYKQFAPLIEEKLVKKDGSIVTVQVVSGIFPYKGIMASLAVVQDISESKRAALLQEKIRENDRLLREAREFDKLKTEFFANISHELRTPLNVILSALQLLNPSSNIELTEEKSVIYLNTMKQNCFRLLRLVSNLIDITKMDSGYFEIHPSNHNIVRVVEDITMSVAEYIENKSISLIFDTDVEERFISCDPDKIERIMLNLISNSVKFTNPGGQIFVNIKDSKDKIKISVKDTGIGIPENKLSMIFERFRQVDKSLTRNHEGSGIGLSLVKSLVELHGGKISVESIYGKGTEFTIELPVVLTDDCITDVENISTPEDYVERINIEFSDIYS